MPAAAISLPSSDFASRRSAAHSLVLALVWVTVACGGVVFSEPAPFDMLTLGLMVLLPAVGLVSVAPALGAPLTLMLIAASSAFVAAMRADEVDLAASHTGVTLYLYLAAFLFAAFVARRPQNHARLLLNAHLWAATSAALVGIVAYFDLLPGSHEVMTLYGRAAGLFKDPNVFGPFLVPAILYVLSRLADGSGRPLMRLCLLAVLGLAMLLSFSRGAWTNLAIAVAIYAALHFVTARSDRVRLRILSLLGATAVASTALVSIALQSEEVADLLAERAALTQDYDTGPDGRFGGQQKALHLAVQYPLGIGAQQFAPKYHHEEPHNVYLAMFLNAGWLGGLSFLALIGVTTLHGLRHALVRGATQPLFLVAYAAFVGHVFEGLLIDLDHWRHFYLLLGLVWGLMASGAVQSTKSVRAAPAR